MLARILDIPPAQEASWGAVLAVLRYEHRDDMKLRWRAERPREGDPFSFVEVDVPGDEVDALRAEIVEVVGMVNEIADRDPLKTMAHADVGLVEVLVS